MCFNLKCANAYAELEVCAKWHYFFFYHKKAATTLSCADTFFTGLKTSICKHAPRGMSRSHRCPLLFFAGDLWHYPGSEQDHILAAGHQRCNCCRGGLYTQHWYVCILTHVKVFQPELGKLQRSYFSFFSLSRGSASVFFVSSKPLSQYKSLTETILFLAFV